MGCMCCQTKTFLLEMSVQELKHISHSGYHIVFFIKRKRPFCVEKIRAEVAETHIKSKAVLKKIPEIETKLLVCCKVLMQENLIQRSRMFKPFSPKR